MGSKARIAKHIVPIIQQCIDDNNITTYIEPFVGGANMIQHIKCASRYGYDSNEYLIDFLRSIQGGWNPLKDLPPSEMTKDLYLTVKKHKTWFVNNIVALVGFCASYNAKWFGGYAGEVQTKIGTIRNYYDEAVRNVLKQAEHIQDISFIAQHYSCLKVDNANTLIYCDPPYEKTTEYKDGFNHSEYWAWVRKISKKHMTLCSEYNAPPDFKCIWAKQITTTLDKNSRSKPTEKLFVYKYGLLGDRYETVRH